MKQVQFSLDYRRLPLVLALLIDPSSAAQQQRGLAFDVVSIRPGGGGMPASMVSGDSVSLSGVSVVELMRMAFDLYSFQFVSVPQWAVTEKFAVMAKTDRPVTPDERKEMMQTLLADRFRLTVHRETRPVSGFALLLAKGGPKFRETTDKSVPKADNVRMVGPHRLLAAGAPISDLVKLLNRSVLSEPVMDKTGLAGRYDFQLAWSDDPQSTGKIQQAILQQLGLKLVAQKVPVEVLVIDQVHMPTPD
jgi:uncharacterized protein (TIGR03435 family)